MGVPGRVPDFLLAPPLEDPKERIRGRGLSFMERATRGLSKLLRDTYVQWDTSSREGLLQRTDPRVKISGLACAVVLVSLKHSLGSQLFVAISILLLASFSKVGLSSVYPKALGLAFVFGFLIPAPSCLNLFSEGEIILPLLVRESPSSFLWFQVPETVGVTREGLSSIGLLWFRIFNSLTCTFLLVNTTPLSDILKGLKHLKMPDSIVVVIVLTYRYGFIFLDLMEQMHRARLARIVRGGKNSETRRWTGERLGFLFGKAQLRCEQTNKAMEARGFSGRVRVEPLGSMEKGDRWKLAVLAIWAVMAASVV
jgi:cobalt ECF transporter T component CbiQ